MYPKNSTDVLRYPINSTEALRYTFMYRTSHTIHNTCSAIHTYRNTYATFIASGHYCYTIVAQDNTCSAIHTYCNTCSTFISSGHFCYAIVAQGNNCFTCSCKQKLLLHNFCAVQPHILHAVRPYARAGTAYSCLMANQIAT